jgi:UMF1 family MFS transporter
MRFFCYLGACSCIGLNWFSLENIYPGLLFYFLGLIGFWEAWFSTIRICPTSFPEQQDKVSARGYSMG